MSGPTASMLVATGLLMCAAAVIALRMVMAAWERRVDHASRQPVSHVVWRRFDAASVAFWVVAYVLGGAGIVAGLAVLLA